MKKILIIVILALCAFSADAQIRFGAKVGVAINKLDFSKEAVTDPNSRTGMSAGIMVEASLPVVGICVESGLLYTHRSVRLEDNSTWKRDYLSVPVNGKFKILIPGVSRIIVPYMFGGPQIDILTNDKDKDEIGGDYPSTVLSWNIGAGLEILRKLQLNVNYNSGITKSVSKDFHIEDRPVNTNGRDRCWTVSVGYFF